MKRRPRDKRLRLIDYYARHLSLYKPELQNVFICPLCKGAFPFTVPADVDALMSLAHILPESIHGTATTICCKRCNSEVGRRFDHHLRLEQNALQMSTGAKPMRATLRIRDATAGVEFLKKDKGYCINVVSRRSSPAIEPTLQEWIERGTEAEFQLSFHTANSISRNRSYIHSAFMLLFSVLGYEYALCPSSDRIREILFSEKPDKQFIQRMVFGVKRDVQGELPSYSRALLMTRPLKCFATIFPPLTPQAQPHMVILPGFEQVDWTPLQEFIEGGETKLTTRWLMLPETGEDHLTAPEWKWFGHEVWRHHGDMLM